MNSQLFLFDEENMLIGKLKNQSKKQYSQNDKAIILKNLYNIFGISLYSQNFVTNKNQTDAAIGYDKQKNVYLLVFKTDGKENIEYKINKDYEFIKENEDLFRAALSKATKKDIYLSDLNVIVISSYFSEIDISKLKNIDLPIKLYTWQYIDTVKYKRNYINEELNEKHKLEAEKYLQDHFKINKFIILNLIYDSNEEE